MKKSLLAVLLAIPLLSLCLAPAISFAADADTCQASALVVSQFITGSCIAGKCHSFIQPATIETDGTCTVNSTFSASSVAYTIAVQGKCNSGRISGSLGASDVPFAGTCGTSGAFQGTASVPQLNFTGKCKENGTFSAILMSANAEVSGTCAAL